LDPRIKIRAKKIWMPLSRKVTHSEKGAELVELALALPFLLVMLLGILDFGGAWVRKDQVTGAARDGARTAVADFNDTTNPQCDGTPCSVQAAASAVVKSLSDANVDTCGLTPSSLAPVASSPFTWTYTSNACADSNLPWTIEVERAVPQIVDGTTALSTRVTVSYPYAWNLVNVPVNPFGNTITLNSLEIMPNLN
jgi:Flp pilus assembly protein TadG